MEDLEENLQNIEKKISNLNDFIALSLRRNTISKELEVLTLEAIKVRDLMTECHQVLQTKLNTIKDSYEMVMSEMRRKQLLLMQYTIKEKKRKLKEAEEEEKRLQIIKSCSKLNILNSAIKGSRTAPSSAVKMLGHNLGKLNINHGLTLTPKIKISEYKNSPLVKKKIISDPIFQFVEFDVQISQQQFDTIPKYMCGRETLDLLNSFLETVIIPCFNEKYQLLHKERSGIRNSNDMELWKLYNEQASSLPGRNFITPGDITRKVNKMLDKKTQNRLVMLRHIGVLQEQRVKQMVCYIWTCSGNF